MLILLPPSEGKTPAATGDAVDWTTLSFPGLNASRAKVLEGLGTVSAHEDALALLGVGASLWADVERNTRLHAEPAAPAHQVYSGVLYDALNYNSLTPTQRKKADESVLVISALWGALRFGDRVPAYRLSMGTALPDVGRLASFWKPHLAEALAAAADGELLVFRAEMLRDLQQVAIHNGNIFESLMDVVKYCSLGQVTKALFEVGGQYRRNM